MFLLQIHTKHIPPGWTDRQPDRTTTTDGRTNTYIHVLRRMPVCVYVVCVKDIQGCTDVLAGCFVLICISKRRHCAREAEYFWMKWNKHTLGRFFACLFVCCKLCLMMIPPCVDDVAAPPAGADDYDDDFLNSFFSMFSIWRYFFLARLE